ncbi:TonB-dependent receptor [Persicobacter psychrovividus]|uniref:SusC/RagA family TonB-linked outer membrane protein n=1 Tax=Persicobacter psychrovividus TaxID=387638 RepID=A0ABN6LGM8_9BACT|nr:SusC/RagA family TonB-linked outer membrane protein [Persicobacter psychrovividus]
MRKHLLLIMFIMMGNLAAFAQDLSISGIVRDTDGSGLPGASVLVKGTTHGVSTDMDGKFTLDGLSKDNTIVFSFIGMESQEAVVGNRSNFDIQLKAQVNNLQEVVVVGYGQAKSKDLTSPIATIKSDELTKVHSTSPMGSIQGKVPGVTVVNSGAPGAGASVHIRGVGSIGNSSPLYVVDGMFYDDINFLNPNDIESMSILKDASAAAIYGVKAANGVVLITTKGGVKNTKMKVVYDGYYGVQTVTQRLKMANTAQYSSIMRASGNADLAGLVDKSMAYYGANGNLPSVDTDWYGELLKDSAPIQSHNLTLSGGTEKSTYSFGVSYFDQDGIMNATGNYNRLSFRTKMDYQLTKALKVGTNFMFTDENSQHDNDGAWFQAFINAPIYPVMDGKLTDAESFPLKFATPHFFGKDANGQPIDGYDTYYTNPMLMAAYTGDNKNEAYRFMPSFFAELKPFQSKDITFRSAINMDYRYGRGRTYTPSYVNGKSIQEKNHLTKYDQWNANYVWDNTATWGLNFGDNDLTVMAGFSVRQNNYRRAWANVDDVKNPDYINSGDKTSSTADDAGSRFRGVSAFSRISYALKDRYLVSATMRADGSSKYQQTWGYFPSIGLGWVMSDENFMAGLKNHGVDFLKLRASWGQLGNDNVAANDGFAKVSHGGLGDSGVFGGTNMIPGMVNQTNYTDLNWEKVEETNVGIDSKFLDYRLNIEADYFRRDTKDLAFSNTLPNGKGSLLRNSGTVRNSGIELNVNWNDKIGDDFSYSIGGNLSKLHNEVISLGDQPNYYTGSPEFPQLTEVGTPLFSFYGYKKLGVYQNQAEIDGDPIAKANGLQPGDFKYEDKDGDGQLTPDDRQLIGNYQPDYTYGINLSMTYKSWTLGATFQGVQGVDLFNRRRADINKHPRNNMDAAVANGLWTGEGSTNAYPSAAGLFKPWNTQKFSTFFIEDGSYFRVQNIRLAYNLPKSLLSKLQISSAQLYLNADRPFTSFKSNGFTPEVPGGIDSGVYPVSSVFSLGANVTF